MDVYFFSEQSHYPSWDKFDGMLRGDIPNKHGDPDTSSRLLNEYLDLYALADECGMNVMVNEHHIASTCMNVSVTLTLAVIARMTKKARLLGLGSIITNRPDPIRVAEEYAVVDSISGGRLDMGMVKGAGWELFASNANPSGGMDRFWEAHDLIIEAMTRNEPFSWEGEHFDYRTVNLWPRPVQQHPPVWFTGNSPGSAKLSAKKGYINAAFLTGPGAKVAFDAYREVYQETFGRPANPDRFAYLAMVSVSRDKAQTERNIEAMRAYLASVARMRPAHMTPPGYAPAQAMAQMMQTPPNTGGGGPFGAGGATDEDLAKLGIMFWGEPERVVDQIAAYADSVGGFGHFLMMGQNAHQSYEDSRDNVTLFGEYVLPELEKLHTSDTSERKPVNV